MTMLEAVKVCYKKYAVFRGRARRSEFWKFSVFNILIIIVFFILAAFVSNAASTETQNYTGVGFFSIPVFNFLYGVISFLPSLAVGVRRLHDVGKSGAYILFLLIPVVGEIIFAIWMLQDSDPGDNRYGPNPKMTEPDVVHISRSSTDPPRKPAPARSVESESFSSSVSPAVSMSTKESDPSFSETYKPYVPPAVSKPPKEPRLSYDVSSRCPACGEPIDEHTRVCPNCGESLGEKITIHYSKFSEGTDRAPVEPTYIDPGIWDTSSESGFSKSFASHPAPSKPDPGIWDTKSEF